MKPSEALAKHRHDLRRIVAQYGVMHPRVFGSAVTGIDQEDSDLDLLVEPTPETTLLMIASLQNEAEALLGVRVDVLTPKALPQRFRDRVLAEAVPL